MVFTDGWSPARQGYRTRLIGWLVPILLAVTVSLAGLSGFVPTPS